MKRLDKDAIKKRVEKIKDIFGEILIAFGIAFITGAVISLSIVETKYWSFFVQGIMLLILGVYTKSLDVNIEWLIKNENKIRVLGVSYTIIATSIFVFLALLLFIFKNYYGFVSMIIIIVFFMIFQYTTLRRRYA